MNQEETVQIFLSRVQTVVNQIRIFEDAMEEEIVVAKVLRSLTLKFDHVVAAIEESKDLDTYSFYELMGSLQTHESRMSKTVDKGDDKTFYMKGESSRGSHNPSRGGRGQGRSNQADSHNGSKRDVQCYYCNKYGHYQAACYKKQREESQANYKEEKDK
jgi:gag-polypeptide of LTR copia-type